MKFKPICFLPVIFYAGSAVAPWPGEPGGGITPIVVTRPKIVNVVGIFVVKHRKSDMEIEKSATKAIVMLLSGKNFY
jgi:hypothetical protein